MEEDHIDYQPMVSAQTYIQELVTKTNEKVEELLNL